MCNYKPFISPAPMSSVFFCLLRATGKLQQCPPPFTIFHSHQLYCLSPGKTLFWTSSVLSVIIWSPLSCVFSCVAYYISVVIILPRHQPSFLAQLCPFQLSSLFFIPILSQIQNGHLQVLAEASFCCLPDPFLYPLKCLSKLPYAFFCYDILAAVFCNAPCIQNTHHQLSYF